MLLNVLRSVTPFTMGYIEGGVGEGVGGWGWGAVTAHAAFNLQPISRSSAELVRGRRWPILISRLPPRWSRGRMGGCRGIGCD